MKKLLNVLLVFIAAAIPGCSTNPVTGDREFNIVSQQQELDIGKQQYAPMRQAQGGDYTADAQLSAYVNQIGQKLAAASDRKLPYEFEVINSSTPNAWALPGGKIAINRGLLTELQSEAELAAVLGHEIVHAAARHGARSMSRGMLLQGAMIGTVIAAQGKDYAQLAQLGASVGAQLINQKYGRDAERESDHFGMRYMSKAGYNPIGAVALQKTFVRLAEGGEQDWLSGLFASHPPSRERVLNNIATAAKLPQGGKMGTTEYRRKIARLIRAKPAYEAYDNARKALAKNDLNSAQRLVQQAVSIEPREGHFYALLGDIALKKGRHSAARNQFDRAIRLNNQFFYYYVQRGAINEKLRNYSAAQQDLERSVKLLPTAEAYNSLGNIAQAQRRYDQAKRYYSKAAGNNSSAGKQAYGSLIDMDLAKNPGAYIKVAARKTQSGAIMADISNPTPRNITGILLTIQVADRNGRTRSLTRSLKGVLAAGNKQSVDIGINNLSEAQQRSFRMAITKAQIAR